MDVKDKIKKLLSLAGNNPDIEEVKQALLKARELMAKYKLSEEDIKEDRGEVEFLTVEDVKWTTDSGYTWVTSLANTIATHYCCAAAWWTPYGTRTHILRLAGFKDDLAICEQVIKFAFHFVASKKRWLGSSGVISYGKGFSLGVKEALSSQDKEHQEWGLVVVVPKEAQDWKNSLKNKEIKVKATFFDQVAYNNGFVEGRRFNPANKLGNA